MFIAGPLIGEVIGLSENADGDAEVYFGPLRLGTLDGVTLKFNAYARPKHRRAIRGQH